MQLYSRGLRYAVPRTDAEGTTAALRRRTPLRLLKRIQCRRSLTKFAIKLNARRREVK